MPGFVTMTFKILVQAVAMVAAVTMVLPTVFIGAGYLLSLILPLGIFECSLLSLGSAFLLILFYNGGTPSPWTSDSAGYNEDDLDYDEFLDEKEESLEEFERMIDEIAEPRTSFPHPKVGRNAPCPCGSGKKLKHCCGRN